MESAKLHSVSYEQDFAPIWTRRLSLTINYSQLFKIATVAKIMPSTEPPQRQRNGKRLERVVVSQKARNSYRASDGVIGSYLASFLGTALCYDIALETSDVVCSMFTNSNLSDMETDYMVFRHDVINKINIEKNRLGLEPEVTAKISRLTAMRIYKVGVSHYGRTYMEGIKNYLKDGVWAIYRIIKYGFQLS